MALKQGIDPRIVMTRIGDAYLSLGNFEQAEVNYRKALALGYDKYAYLGLARIHTETNHMDEALKIFTMLLEKEPNDARVTAEVKEFAGRYPAC
jgi:tetratricopeptide (TPR) repeat protein